MIKVGDIVYVSNPDTKYEKEYHARKHKSFFGRATEVEKHSNGQICVVVEFPSTPNGCSMEWCYNIEELSLASELKNLTLEEFSNRFGVDVFAEYL